MVSYLRKRNDSLIFKCVCQSFDGNDVVLDGIEGSLNLSSQFGNNFIEVECLL
jgi:hypothetical protein